MLLAWCRPYPHENAYSAHFFCRDADVSRAATQLLVSVAYGGTETARPSRLFRVICDRRSIHRQERRID
jgi:hypothetical protein